MLIALLVLLGLAILAYAFAFVRAAIAKRVGPSPEALALGAVVSFFDTLGIGSFAPTTAWFKFRRMVPDRLIPPTLLVGLTPPAMAQSIIFLILLGVLVDPVLLFGCATAVLIGGLVGAPLVARARVWIVQLVVAIGLVLAAAAYAMTNLHLFPGGGTASGLPLTLTIVAIARQFRLRHPRQFRGRQLCADPGDAEPDGHGPEALLPDHGDRRLAHGGGRERRATSAIGEVDLRVVLGLAIGGIPAVFVAAFIVKEMPLETLRWLVFVVVLYTAAVMGLAALRGRREGKGRSGDRAVAPEAGPDRESARCGTRPQPGIQPSTIRCARRTPIASPSTRATQFDDDYQIATLDLAPFLHGDAKDKARFAADFGAALQEIGFAVLTGHGVDAALYDEMHDQRPRPVHVDIARREDALPRRAPRLGQPGLFPDRGDQRDPSRPGRRLGLVPARLRHAPASRPAVSRRRITGRAPNMSGSFAVSRSPTKRCSSRSPRRCSRGSAAIRISMTTNSRTRISACALNYYPPMSAAQERSGAGRCSGHEDVDLFTILPAPKRRRPAGVEPSQQQVGASARAARFDHHQHRRLHAADHERPPAVDDPPRRQAAPTART